MFWKMNSRKSNQSKWLWTKKYSTTKRNLLLVTKDLEWDQCPWQSSVPWTVLAKNCFQNSFSGKPINETRQEFVDGAICYSYVSCNYTAVILLPQFSFTILFLLFIFFQFNLTIGSVLKDSIRQCFCLCRMALSERDNHHVLSYPDVAMGSRMITLE